MGVGGGGEGFQSNPCLTQNFIFRNFEFDNFRYLVYLNKFSLLLTLYL